jgi:hypothetical protein
VMAIARLRLVFIRIAWDILKTLPNPPRQVLVRAGMG